MLYIQLHSVGKYGWLYEQGNMSTQAQLFSDKFASSTRIPVLYGYMKPTTAPRSLTKLSL